MTATLYVILGSHACRAGMLMLDHKGVEYETVTLPTGAHAPAVRVLGFPGRTVPALRLDHERVQTNPAIARFLDRLCPDPPLFPADPAERARVEEAERFADQVFQMVARRITLAGALHGPDGLRARGGKGRLGPLLWRHDITRFIGGRVIGRLIFDVNPETERRLLDEIPARLDRIDAWIAEGILNGEMLNAADFQLAPSLALFYYRPDLKREIEARPAGELVDRVLPEPAPAPSAPAPN